MNTLPAKNLLQTYLELDAFTGAPVSESDLKKSASFIATDRPGLITQVRIAHAVDQFRMTRLIKPIRSPHGERQYVLTDTGLDCWQHHYRCVVQRHCDTFRDIAQRARTQRWFLPASQKFHPTLFCVYGLKRLDETSSCIQNRLALTELQIQRFLCSAAVAIRTDQLRPPQHTLRDILPDTNGTPVRPLADTFATRAPAHQRKTHHPVSETTMTITTHTISYDFGDVTDVFCRQPNAYTVNAHRLPDHSPPRPRFSIRNGVYFELQHGRAA